MARKKEPDHQVWVTMTHPKVEGPSSRVTMKAYKEVWKEKGWKIAQDKKPEIPSDDGSS